MTSGIYFSDLKENDVFFPIVNNQTITIAAYKKYDFVINETTGDYMGIVIYGPNPLQDYYSHNVSVSWIFMNVVQGSRIKPYFKGEPSNLEGVVLLGQGLKNKTGLDNQDGRK